MKAHRRWSLVVLVLAAVSCKNCVTCDDETEEEEEKNLERDHFWRAQLSISGKGQLKTFVPAFDCTSDGTVSTGECGPKLLRFKELRPPTVEATPAPGWTFDHWESLIREPDGAIVSRRGLMPDGPIYINGFGYSDTGELDLVKAVFVMSKDSATDAGT